MAVQIKLEAEVGPTKEKWKNMELTFLLNMAK